MKSNTVGQKSLPDLKFLCLGAGAIGTYIGGSLVLSGQKVIFLEQPSFAEILRDKGLHLNLKHGSFHIPKPEMVTSIDEALTQGPFDIAILAVKSYDTRTVLESLAPYSIALPSILCLQNGVDNEPLIAEILGVDKVIPGTVTTAVGKSGPGSITVEKLRGMGVSSHHALADALVAVLNRAGLCAFRYQSPQGMKWSKMLTNLLANATSAILDQTPAEIFTNPKLYRLEIALYREALRVMAAQGIPVINLPKTPVQLLSFFIQALPPELSRPLLTRPLVGGRGDKMPSFHIDLHNGNKYSEVGYLNGAVVRYGEKLGIPTPANRLLCETLTDMVAGKINLNEFSHQPEKLLDLYDHPILAE
jgi:2-dehydropantoate 2-reductase